MSDSPRSLRGNERLWANRSGRSPKMSESLVILSESLLRAFLGKKLMIRSENRLANSQHWKNRASHGWREWMYQYVWHLFIYCISSPKTRHIPLHQIPPWEVRFLWRNFGYFGTVYVSKVVIHLAYSGISSPLSKLQCFFFYYQYIHAAGSIVNQHLIWGNAILCCDTVPFSAVSSTLFTWLLGWSYFWEQKLGSFSDNVDCYHKMGNFLLFFI